MTQQDDRGPIAEGENRYEASERALKTDDPGKGPQGVVPNMQAQIVMGVFDTAEAAQGAVNALEGAGYPHDDISLVMQQPGSAPEIGAEETKADQGTAAGIGVGAVLGGIAGVALLAVPGVGPLLAAGPLAAVLGAMSGAALGGLVGSFSGLGIPTEQAKEYEAAVREGGVVVAVKAPDDNGKARVTEILNQHGARSVNGYTQAL